MVDRTDIDALLISALYGELTPADEARLTAHLESHPADRTALAELTHTRAAVRDSRLFVVQLEPPPSVSALLLREAGRRAPRAREEAGWFQRFTRSFMAHPAMAAAAMLVLVVGVAGTIYVRKGDQFASPSVAQSTTPAGAMAPAAPAEAPGAAAPAPAPTTAPAAEDVARRDQQAQGSGSFGVGLAEGTKLAAPVQRASSDDNARVTDGYAKDSAAGVRKELLHDPAVVATKPSKKGSGIELRSRELVPKDLDERPARAKADRVDDSVGADRGADAAGPTGGAAAPAAPAVQVAREAELGTASKAKTPAPAKTVARGSVAKPAPEPPPPPAPVTASSESLASADKSPPADRPASPETKQAKAEEKAVDSKLFAWAAQQHRQVISLVGANKCREAAAAAVAIYNRAPEYYAANVATDRSIKPCLAYVTTEREREDRSRAAAKRANAVDAPAAAPPTK